MKVLYKYDKNLMELTETPNGDDIEFHLAFLEVDLKKRIDTIREFFDQNSIVTDILVYTHSNNELQIIVRKDFYEDFLLQLFKQQLLLEMKWV